MTTRQRNKQEPLKHEYDSNYKWEIGVDEAGRGPLFGRLYVAGVILPKSSPDFKYELLKDSKKFHSEKKIKEVAEYIKEHAVAWYISFSEPDEIDQINIRQAVLKCMNTCCRKLISYINNIESNENIDPTREYLNHVPENVLLMIDGNDFPPFTLFDNNSNQIIEVPSITVEGGDNTYCAIAAASILAKVARDEYIKELCEMNIELDEKYGINKNKGYGTKIHMDGIKTYGITQWHRKSYKPCK